MADVIKAKSVEEKTVVASIEDKNLDSQSAEPPKEEVNLDS